MNDIRKVLSYNDVLLCPRYSELEHLSDADIKVYCGCLTGVYPIINAPMDKVCSVDLIKFMDRLGCPTTIHRWFNSPEEQIKFFEDCDIQNDYRCFISVGNVYKWKDWIDKLISYRSRNGRTFSLLVDVANGDTKSAIDTVKYIHDSTNNMCYIMAGNVATKSGFRRLQEAGANFIRVGIGGGCFTPNMEVMTINGKKKISEVQNGDLVYTHTGEIKEVIALISYYSEQKIIKINNEIECTESHEFYVIHKKYQNIVNEENIHQYAQWIKAENLTEDFLMIELE